MNMSELEAQRLLQIKRQDLREFRAEVAVARRLYTLREIAHSLSLPDAPVPHTTVRKWETSADPSRVTQLLHEREIPDIPLRQRRKEMRVKPIIKRARMDIPPAERDEFLKLAITARKLRGWTRQDAPERAASEEFNKRLHAYYDRGVSISRLAFHAKVTWRAIAARLERSADEVTAA